MSRTPRSLSLSLSFGLSLAVTSSAATGGAVIYVDSDAGPVGDGTSWATAFDELQDALAVVSAGDEIRVAEGIHYPDDAIAPPLEPRDATFLLVSGVQILGGYAGFGEPDPDLREPGTRITILSGDLGQNDLFEGASVLTSHGGIVPDATGALGTWLHQDDNAFHVVTASGTTGAVLDGLTITAGRAEASASAKDGAGLYSSAGSPTLVGVVFQGNYVEERGGALAGVNGSAVVLEDVAFLRNAAGNHGGGLFNQGSTAHMDRVLFQANAALNVSSGGFGGGMYNREGGDSVLLDVRFLGNTARRGGGLYNQNSDSTLTNVLFSGNASSSSGGAIGISSSSPALFVLTNASVFSNSAAVNGGAINATTSVGSTLLIQNSVFWENSAPEGFGPELSLGGDGTTTLSHTLVDASESDAWIDAGGNLTAADLDPLFRDGDGADGVAGTLDDDLQPVLGSPAIDAGDDSADLDGTGPGTETIADVPTDLGGGVRIFDGDGDSTATVDLGAYELGAEIFSDGFESGALTAWPSSPP